MSMKEQHDHNESDSPTVVIERLPEPVPQERSVLQIIGLSPGAAVCAIGTDLLLFGADTISAELLLPFCMLAAGGLGFIVYRMQRNWGDSHDNALMKGVLIALLTAIPVPLTPLLAGPAGIAGFIRNLRGR
jgi:hypothetical protein